MAEILVDVVAAASRIGQPRAVPKPPEEPEREDAVVQAQACPLGHPSDPGVRFCATCGLPVGGAPVGPRVDLEAVREAVRPLATLDAAERARRDREHAEAMAANLRAEQEVVDIAAQHDPSTAQVHIHFITDGFTWAGQVWYAGQELKIGPEHPRWESVRGWITLTKQEQFQRYGRVFFDTGPYPGHIVPGALLPTAGVAQWAAMRGGLPAVASPDGDGSLIPH